MSHQWVQVDYREIWEKQAFTLVTAARTIPKGERSRFIGAHVHEWCHQCGCLRHQILMGPEMKPVTTSFQVPGVPETKNTHRCVDPKPRHAVVPA